MSCRDGPVNARIKMFTFNAKSHARHRQTLWENSDLLVIKSGGIESYHCAVWGAIQYRAFGYRSGVINSYHPAVRGPTNTDLLVINGVVHIATTALCGGPTNTDLLIVNQVVHIATTALCMANQIRNLSIVWGFQFWHCEQDSTGSKMTPGTRSAL